MSRESLQQVFAVAPFLLTPSGAERYLDHLDTTTSLLALFARYFPAEFAQARAHGLPLIAEQTDGWSACELEFFRLVDERLFPLPLDYLRELGDRTFASQIPLQTFPVGSDGELSLGWALVHYLVGLRGEEQVREHGIYEEGALFALPILRRDTEKALLILRCQAQAEPLALLPQAVAMVMRETGTVWLDEDEEGVYLSPSWSEDDIDELHWQYLQAIEIGGQAERFCEWLEADPQPRFTQVTRLWNACARDTAPPEARLRCRSVPASQFVEGIRFGELFGETIALPASLPRQ